MDRLTLAQAEKLKATYPYYAGTPFQSAFEKTWAKAQDDMRKVLRRAAEKGVEDFEGKYVQQKTGQIGKLLKEYKEAKKKYGIGKTVGKAAEERRVKDLGINTLSPSTKAAAAIGYLGHAGHAATNPLAAFVKGVTFGAANHIVRGRGAAATAVTADFLSKMIAKGNSKYAPQLRRAAAKGNANLAATHLALVKAHEDYERQYKEHTLKASSSDEIMNTLKKYEEQIMKGEQN